MPLFTLGHGTANAGRLAELLSRAGVVLVVDVRREPGSRRNPDAARDALARWLPEQGVAYRWDVRLGGRRPDVPGSPDTAPPHRALAGYAAHMRTPEFAAAVDDLLGGPAPAAVLCSEGDWRRCHRRMIADHVVLVRGVPVRHLLPDGHVADHVVTATARLREDGRLVYDGGQATLL
ncbi:DNA repair protein [Pseudonocardia sp. CNS-139]|nr:DNA repair protein [Pseudonocardia sp. CNS-139]